MLLYAHWGRSCADVCKCMAREPNVENYQAESWPSAKYSEQRKMTICMSGTVMHLRWAAEMSSLSYSSSCWYCSHAHMRHTNRAGRCRVPRSHVLSVWCRMYNKWLMRHNIFQMNILLWHAQDSMYIHVPCTQCTYRHKSRRQIQKVISEKTWYLSKKVTLTGNIANHS